MKLYMLEPEVAGELGEKTLFNNDNSVSRLHYEFHGWLGDDLLESTPCYIVSELLGQSLIMSNITGFHLEEMEGSLTDEFIELYPNRELPTFKRLIPLGNIIIEGAQFSGWSGEDICITPKKYLVVSEKAFEVFNAYNLKHCEVTILSN